MIWTPFLLHRGPILNFDEDEIIKSFLWNLLPFQDFTTVTPYHTSSSTKDLRYLMVSKDIHSHFSSAIHWGFKNWQNKEYNVSCM